MGCVCGREQLLIQGRRFRLIECIAEGGFSFVYLAEEAGAPRGRRKWAIKRIDCHSAADEQRAKDEINLHERLTDCRNILPCETYAFLEKQRSSTKHAVLVLPYYKKGSLATELSSRFASKEHLPEERVFQLFIDVCNAVQALHNLQPTPFAHRDIKPLNILIGVDDKAVLMDLGSARPARVSFTSIRDAQAFQDYAAEHCSMPYRAPEMFNVESGTEITEKTDMWSLGCLLYAMCFFKSPYDIIYERGDSIALAAQSGRIFIPEDSGYSKFLLDLIRLLMQVNPVDRPDIGSVLWQLESVSSNKFIDVNIDGFRYSKFLLDLIRLLMQVNPVDRPDIGSVLWQLESVSSTLNASIKLGHIV